MSKTIEAVYEHGVFRPVESVTLSEGARVKLTISDDSDDPIYTIYEDAAETGISDLAANIDHYLYGLPKRCQ